MRIVPVDVERLIPDDHEARAIRDFVGSLDLASYYKEIGSLEGEGQLPMSVRSLEVGDAQPGFKRRLVSRYFPPSAEETA
jgi:hypothetical protein